MEKKIEILISENGDMTINNFGIKTAEMIRVLTSIVHNHAAGNYNENNIDLDKK